MVSSLRFREARVIRNSDCQVQQSQWPQEACGGAVEIVRACASRPQHFIALDSATLPADQRVLMVRLQGGPRRRFV